MNKYYQQECDRDWPGGGIRLINAGEAILIDVREDDERDEYTF